MAGKHAVCVRLPAYSLLLIGLLLSPALAKRSSRSSSPDIELEVRRALNLRFDLLQQDVHGAQGSALSCTRAQIKLATSLSMVMMHLHT